MEDIPVQNKSPIIIQKRACIKNWIWFRKLSKAQGGLTENILGKGTLIEVYDHEK